MDAATIKSARGRSPLKASSTVRAEVQKRGKRPGNLCYFYGAKVDRDWVARSSLELAAMLHAEASQDILTYSCDLDLIWSELSSGGYRGSKPDMRLQRRGGPPELWAVGHQGDTGNDPCVEKQRETQEGHAKAVGYAWKRYTEADAMREQVMLMNWLSVNPVLLQFRHLEVDALREEISRLVIARDGITVRDVYPAINMPRAHIFVALMRAHQRRSLTVEIRKRALGLSTPVIPWSEK
ncbi:MULTISPECIES: hypothetical protein [unclassified Variovorax]|uniref:hypothetical protein n=1 Tax=unclassified Variovorax TaxID=663243 RepID=UPI000A76DF12|nr:MULTISPECIES: hypothetical protein [unclassified Variovorax]PNG48948.1 hypothetical protein CHC07_06705 [Variovorax sp. B4]PNG49782.1 hypothetical protein CHC06_05363 [Variovorax sp. B2]PNG50629.1 hypothetical protein CHC06_06253 [Variovorax sp. B2]PNG50654.1 hypothetical protein CHC07_05268 [Variovorax sp. B4]VTV17824.1 hypothetical protein WDL1P1_00690 [Variovorax sp. WDL1]